MAQNIIPAIIQKSRQIISRARLYLKSLSFYDFLHKISRVLAVWGGLVQRIRDMRRARVLSEYNAHVLHLSGPLPGHP